MQSKQASESAFDMDISEKYAFWLLLGAALMECELPANKFKDNDFFIVLWDKIIEIIKT